MEYKRIEHLHDKDITLSNGIVLKENVSAFQKGDELHISEKLDGSNASFQYLGDGKFNAWSRRQKLSKDNNLFGFYQYCEKLANDIYLNEAENAKKREKLSPELRDLYEEVADDLSAYIFYGEWMGKKNVVEYNEWVHNKWFVFDIFDLNVKDYLPQNLVKDICARLEFLQPCVLAIIPNFVSWDAIFGLANINNSFYGNEQEGIVIKNESKLYKSVDGPITLKIVNEQFQESKHRGNLTEEQFDEKARAFRAYKSIVTVPRVQKVIRKLQEDNQLPCELSVSDISLVMSKVPGLVIKDIKVEEPEIFTAYECYHGKVVSSLVKLCLNEILAN